MVVQAISPPLSVSSIRSYYHNMEDEKRRTEAVRDALQLSPASVRLLAQEAGVSDTLLRLTRDGHRTAMPVVVEALADALERMAARDAKAARVLRDTLKTEGRQ